MLRNVLSNASATVFEFGYAPTFSSVHFSIASWADFISQVAGQVTMALHTNFDCLLLHVLALIEFSKTGERSEDTTKRTMSTDLICAEGHQY